MEHLLHAAAERFRASRFVRPSSEKPLDTEAIGCRIRKVALVRAAIRHALMVGPEDTGEMVRRVATAYLISRYMSRKMVRRVLDAERPWDSQAERERMEKTGQRLRSEILASRKVRAGEPLVVRTSSELDADRQERFAPTTEDSKLRQSVEQPQKSGRTAYDTARAVYLQRCPELEHKLLHLLRRDGVQPETEFLSRHSNLAVETTDSHGTLRAALRQLAEANKVRRVRSSKTGQVFLTATEPLDETDYRRSLNSLIRDERFGIVNPWTKTRAVHGSGDPGEWEKSLEELDVIEARRLAPWRLRNAEVSEQPLLAAEQVTDYSALEELNAVAEVMA